MNSLVSLIVIINLLSATHGCHRYADGVHLISRLNDFYGFDHNIFFMDTLTDLNCWFPTSQLISGMDFTPQTVYTAEDFSDTKVTEAVALNAKSGKKTFLVIVVAALKFENGPKLLTEIKIIRDHNINVKIGVFYDRNVTSLNVINQLFRWSWSAGIVNIFSAFLLSSGSGKSSSFNVFKYDPFTTSHLINVTGAESLPDYFSDNMPNYRKYPMQFVRIRGLNASFCERGFWNAVVDAFNASVFQVDISHAEVGTKRASVGLLLHERHEAISRPNFTYPHRQTVLLTIVPHAKPYSNFVAYLQNGTWTLLFAYTFVVIVLSSILLAVSGYLRKRKILLFQNIADIVNLLINDNSAIKYQHLSRADVFVIVPLTFTGLIVTNGILSIFQSYITAPIYQPQINSYKDLYASSVPILVNEIGWKDKFEQLLEYFTQYGGWSKRLHGVDLQQMSHGITAFNNSIAFFVPDQQAGVILEVQRRLALKAYHVLGEQFSYKQMTLYELSSTFPFIESINDMVHRLNGAGLIEKWGRNDKESIAKQIWNNNPNHKIEDVSSISELAIPTAVWCGWIASVVIFICELFWSKIRLHQKRGKAADPKKSIQK